MFFLSKQRSYQLFLLLCLSFFSCEQLIEIIKPTPPKGEQTCRVINENFPGGNPTEYNYDSLGRLSSTVYETDSLAPEELRYLKTYFYYNERNQLSGQYQYLLFEGGFSTSISYNSQGRVDTVRTQDLGKYGSSFVEAYRYYQDTVVVNTTTKNVVGQESTSEKMYIFEKGDLVKIRYADWEGNYEDGREDIFSYTSLENKLSEVEKRVAFINGSPLMSKHLVSRSADSQGGVTTYNWEVNEAGYVVKRTITTENGNLVTTYQYSCEQE